jgi:hypothetical protein
MFNKETKGALLNQLKREIRNFAPHLSVTQSTDSITIAQTLRVWTVPPLVDLIGMVLWRDDHITVTRWPLEAVRFQIADPACFEKTLTAVKEMTDRREGR